MRELKVKVLESIDDIRDLYRADIIIAKISPRNTPFFGACIEKPSNKQIRLITEGPIRGGPMHEYTFNYSADDVTIGNLGGLKKETEDGVSVIVHQPINPRYDAMKGVMQEAGLWQH